MRARCSSSRSPRLQLGARSTPRDHRSAAGPRDHRRAARGQAGRDGDVRRARRRARRSARGRAELGILHRAEAADRGRHRRARVPRRHAGRRPRHRTDRHRRAARERLRALRSRHAARKLPTARSRLDRWLLPTGTRDRRGRRRDLVAFGLSRITCNLPTAPTDVAHDYQLHYVANANPTLLPLASPTSGAAVPADAIPRYDVTLTASWPDGRRELPLLRRVERDARHPARGDARVVVRDRRSDRGRRERGRGRPTPATTVSTTWQTPAAGPAWLWLVLRDSRGGIATQTIAVTYRV